jgi:hypothetical protein
MRRSATDHSRGLNLLAVGNPAHSPAIGARMAARNPTHTFGINPVFAASFLSDTPSSTATITYGGGTNGTRVNSAGVIVAATCPRIDYDPVTRAVRGLLVEEQRTNLCINSGDASVRPRNEATTATGVGIDGATRSIVLVDTANNAPHNFQQNFQSLAASTVVTYTAYVKPLAKTICWMQGITGTFAKTYFTLTGSGTVSSTGSGHTASIEPAMNGFYRIRITFTSSGNVGPESCIGSANSVGSENYVGVGEQCLAIDGTQIEAGDFPTSYIPTAGSAVTRAADEATITAGAFSAWYAAAQGTFVLSAIKPSVTTAGIAVQVDDNTASEVISLGADASANPLFVVTDGGVTQASIDAGTLTAGAEFKLSARYQANNFAAALNNGAAVTDVAGTVPTVDRLRIGANTSATNWNGWIRSIAYYNQALAALP